MGWLLSSARLRKELLAPDPSVPEALDASALSYRGAPHCLSTRNFSTDLSALVRRLGSAIADPSATMIGAAVMSNLPPLDLGTNDEPMNIVLGLDWVAAHTPLRAIVNRARSRPALVAANRLTVADIGPETHVNFSSIMGVPTLKRHFFQLCADDLRDRICRLPVSNVVVTFLSCDGKVHTTRFSDEGVMQYEVTERMSGYGEADLEIPLYMNRLAPGAKWQYSTIDFDSAFVIALLGLSNVTIRLSKTEDPSSEAEGRKRKRAVHEIIEGGRLCAAWPNIGAAFCRIAQGDTDYSKGLKPYGIKGLLSKEVAMSNALYVNERNELVLDLKAFVAVIASASTHKPRRVYIGADKVIHLTSRPGTEPCERPLEMLHQNLIKLLWTVAYYRAAGYDEKRVWKGPDTNLHGLRLWERGAQHNEALSGVTTPAVIHVLGRVPATSPSPP